MDSIRIAGLRRACLAVAAAAVLAVAPACGAGDDESATRPATTTPAVEGGAFAEIPRIVDEVQPSIVAVLVRGARGAGEGSGVVWSSDGLIVTNNHVVAGAEQIEVAFASGERVEARVRAADPRSDLAVLEVDRTGLPEVELADALPRVGELAVALGNPLGFENTATAGIVSGLHRSIPTGGTTPALVDLIQTDAAISPGNSGGALVDGDGKVIGINVAYIPPQARAVSIGFAIPAPTVRSVVQQLLESGEVRRAYLGLQPSQLTPAVARQFGLEAEAGALVLAVEPGGPAAEAGLQPGDVIVSAAGQPVSQVEDLYSELRQRDPGDPLELTILREGDRRAVVVTLGRRP